MGNLVDGITGRIMQRVTHKSAQGPVHAVAFEHFVVYTFWSRANKRTEISSITLYEGAMGKFDLNPWKYKTNGTTFSSMDLEQEDVIALQQTYFLSRSVAALGVTSSRLGITEKRLIVGLKSGSVNALDSRFLDPRRPLGKATPQEMQEGLISYIPEIPMMPPSTFSYNLTIERISGIYTTPTKLESTCLVLVTGIDMFYSRLQPSMGFDLLAEDFNSALLVTLTLGLCIAVILLFRAVRRNQLTTAWK